MVVIHITSYSNIIVYYIHVYIHSWILLLMVYVCTYRYRLMAFDHDIFSFTDKRFDHWPLVLVTNPKDSRFSVPGREPLGRISHSTHVRSV